MAGIKLRNTHDVETVFNLLRTPDNNHNLLVTGEPGTGKSTLVSHVATAAEGHRVRIITAGGRYREVVAGLGGVYHDCSVFRPFSFNPFHLVRDWKNDRLSTNAIFARLLRLTPGSGHDLMEPAFDLMEQAVSKAWSEYTHEANITTLFKALDSFDGVPLPVQRIAEEALRPFLPGELYEGWLDGPPADLSDQPCVAYNLEHLQVVPALYKAMVPALLHLFATDSAGATASIPRIIIIDDLWQLNIPTTSLTRIFREGMKEGTAVVTITDSFVDLRHMTSGNIVTANSPHRVFFACPAMSFNYTDLTAAGVPEAAIDQVDSPEGRSRHRFYLTTLDDVFSLDRPTSP